MDILILDVKGKFAHFRKFYTNSSSLSYSAPPRTAVIGLLAAVLGYERDSYYELFSKEHFNVGVEKVSNTRRLMQTVNYIKATSPKSILYPKEHTQIPMEIITGDTEIIYRLYLNHEHTEILDELERRAKDQKYIFPPYFGAAPFNCTLEFVDRVEAHEYKSDNKVEISTLINSDFITPGSIELWESELILLKEKMPCDFLKDRIIGEVNSYIFEDTGKSLKLNLNCQYYNTRYSRGSQQSDENIVFM